MSNTSLAVSNVGLVNGYRAFDSSILANQLSQQTLMLYKESWSKYVEFATGTGLDVTKHTTLQMWRDGMAADVAKYSPNTINRHLAAIKRVIKEAYSREYIGNEVYAAFKAVDGVSKKALKANLKSNARTKISVEQMRQLVNAPDTDTISGLMHHALLMTLASTGLRISEALAIKVTDIKKNGQGYIVANVMGKNKVEASDVAISANAVLAIREWLAARTINSQWVFTGFSGGKSRIENTEAIHPVSAWELVKRYSAKVGIDGIKPHDFRRFVGTQLAKNKGIQYAQKQLRHANPQTTIANYVMEDLPEDLVEGLF